MAKTAGQVEPKLEIGDGIDQSEVKKVAVKKVINWKSRLNVLINRRVDDLKSRKLICIQNEPHFVLLSNTLLSVESAGPRATTHHISLASGNFC